PVGPQMVMERLESPPDKGAVGGLQSNRISHRKKLLKQEFLIRSDLRRRTVTGANLGTGRLWARLQATQNVTAGAVFENGQLLLHLQVHQISHHRLLVKAHAPYVAKSGRGKSPGRFGTRYDHAPGRIAACHEPRCGVINED